MAVACALGQGCTFGATEVLVQLGTDAPIGRALTIVATVRAGGSLTGDGGTHTWLRGGPMGTANLPGSFGVTPGRIGNDSAATLVVTAELAPGSAGEPPVTFRRVARFRFTPHTQTVIPLFLPIACGNASADCVNPSTPCTVSARCEELGQTCGDLGTCVSETVVPQLSTDAAVTPPAPRPIRPLSTATVTSRRPTLRWQLAPGSDGARVQICRDRACSAVIVSMDAMGSSVAPPTQLPPGVLFWRAFGRLGPVTGLIPSAVWQFTVGVRTATGANSSYGTTLDVNGDGYADVAIGAPHVTNSTGRVHVHLGSASGLSTTATTVLTGPDGVQGDFGLSVASAGDVNGDGFADLIVGAYGYSGYAGRAHVYLGSATGLPVRPFLTLDGPDGAPGDFASSVASAGDVNGDGYADLVVGAYGYMGYTGRAYVYLGSIAGPLTTPVTTLTGADGALGSFGGSVASAGDLNGDGFADVVVGAPGAFSGAGRAYVYLGSASGLPATPSTTLTGGGGAFGSAVAGAGDVNGDGYTELVVGAPDLGGFAGHSYAFLGGAAGPSATPSVTLTAPDGANGHFGISLASLGDVNGDGYGDVVVGASHFNQLTGRAHVYLGGAMGLSTTPATSLTGPDLVGGNFGVSVAGAGDVHGDGFADLIVGASGAAGGAGRAFVYSGGAAGVSAMPATSLTGPDGAGGSFGASVTMSGVPAGDRAFARDSDRRLDVCVESIAPWHG